MSTFHPVRDDQTGEEVIAVSVGGPALLQNPLLNKGSAFTNDERRALGLLGLIPSHQSTMDEQLQRRYTTFQQKTSDLEKYSHLSSLQDRNETLFYRLLQEHIAEMMPIIYTPTVGAACQQYSRIYERPRGMFLSYPHRTEIDAMLANVPHSDVRVIVVTDGGRILGLGDLGIGGMGIPIGKLALYTLCAGIHPATTLPIVLDMGTNNQKLLDDPLYIGWRHTRVDGQAYDDFIETFVQAVERHFPHAILQWEDFANQHASRLLARYQDRLCTFNDDIQGTGAVTLAGLLAACSVTGQPLTEQRIIMFGAGSAAMGIVGQIVAAMQRAGLTTERAHSTIWLVDSHGLVHTARGQLDPFKRDYARPWDEVTNWQADEAQAITLLEVVKQMQPTALIGTTAQPGAFTAEIVRAMAARVARPIIFPLSNPNSQSEAVPAALLEWTDGRALIATGSPFAPVRYATHTIEIAQCNNVFIFPGVGLGVIATNARRVTEAMFAAAGEALSMLSPARRDPTASLFPALADVRAVSRQVALAVGAAAQAAGLAEMTTADELEQRVNAVMWAPHYVRLTLSKDSTTSGAGIAAKLPDVKVH